jgi:hypothetical protein
MFQPYIKANSWKGPSSVIGRRSTHIRPLTNNDPTNDYPSKFGLPRPIKHYRKGSLGLDRAVRSSTGMNVGGGVITEYPGDYSIGIKEEQEHSSDKIPVVPNWIPIVSLSEKPQTNSCNSVLCCNQQKKAVRRSMYASTNINKNYYQTSKAYLYNRCKTFEQRQFNYVKESDGVVSHVAQCPSSSRYCSKVIYKPNNEQYSTQGAVSCSARIIKLNVDTISLDAANKKRYKDNPFQATDSSQTYMYKDKVPQCSMETYHRNGNAIHCRPKMV